MAVDAKTIKAVFLAALEKATPTDRAGYLDEACAGDPVLRERVAALLQSHDRPDALLDQPAVEHVAAEVDAAALDFLQPSTKPDSLGRLGHYEVLETIGRGGMGIVVRAFDDKLHRVVAIKVLSPALAENGAARQRFVREARAAAAVTHQNVIAIHGVEDAGPVPYLIMQCIDGKTLQEKLDRTGPLEIKEILRIGLQIAEGLAAAHRQGLIHRDIKPANILLENGVERVKITDFGLARAVDDASLTQSGFIAGTPLFMSPEQARGDHVDHRTDLFSLGSVLYSTCAGHPPFRADTSLAVLKRVCDETPRPLRELKPEIPEWLQGLIAKLHAKNPTDRYGSAVEVAATLGRRLAQLQTDGVFSDTDGATMQLRPRPKPANRRRTAAILAGAAVLVVAGSVAGWLIYQSWSDKRQAANTGSTEPSGSPSGPTPAPGPAHSGPVVLKPSRPPLKQHARGVRILAFSRDGTVMASGGGDRNIYLWNPKTWEARGPIRGHSGEVAGLAFSPDGSRLASVCSNPDTCLIRVWDVAKGQEVDKLGSTNPGMWDVAYSSEGQTLACGGWDKTLHLFDVANGNERTITTHATRHVRTLSFSPDSRRIVAGGSGPTSVWDATTGEEVPLTVQLPEGMCPTILPGGKMLAGWNHGDGLVTLCDLPSGQVRVPWRAHQQRIEGLAASADGRFLATIGSDGTASVWSTADQKEVATLIGHKGSIHAVAFSPDGAQLVTGGAEDFTILVWDLPEICRTAK